MTTVPAFFKFKRTKAESSPSQGGITHNINAPLAVFRDVGGHQYHNMSVHPASTTPLASASNARPPGPSPFNDAPIDNLSTHFTGRRRELALIAKAFEKRRNIPLRCALHGNQGVGKSQLTYSWAKSTFDRKENAYIIWISATTVEKLFQGFCRLLRFVNHPDQSHPDQNARLEAARRWLEEVNTGNWLLVFDNVFPETVDFLRQNLPRVNGRGTILFTTRTRDVAIAITSSAGEQHKVIEVPLLNVEEGVELFCGHFESGKVDPSSPTVRAIVKAVGGLPLAISHAAAYMDQSRISLNALLELYRGKHKIHAVAWEHTLSDYEHKSVAATFTSQLQDLDRQCPDASKLLRVITFYDPESIPLEMLVTGANAIMEAQLPSTRSPFTALLLELILSPIPLQNAITQLQARCLVSYHATSQSPTLRMHDLIHLVVLENTKSSGMNIELFDFAVELACAAFWKIEDPCLSKWWPQCELLIPHIQSLTLRQETSTTAKKELLLANMRQGVYLNSLGRYVEAESLHEQIRPDMEQLFGPNDHNTLTVMSNLAFVYQSRGRDVDAEMLFKQVLDRRKSRLGSAIVHAQQVVAFARPDPLPTPKKPPINNASSSPTEDLPMAACPIVPQIALDYAVACESSIKMALKPVCTTADAAYIIQVGFNENLLQSRQGALQEIYVFLNFDIPPTDQERTLDGLSRILSPFPCTVHTPSAHRQLSIVGKDGSIQQHDNMWALFHSSGIYTPEEKLLAEGHLSPAGLKAPILLAVEVVRLNDETSSGPVDRGNGTGQAPGDAREPIHDQLGLPSTPRHDGSAHSGDNNRRDGGLAPVDGVASSTLSATAPRTPSVLTGDDGRGPDPPATAKQNCLSSLDIPFSTSLKVKWTGERNTSQEFKTTSRLLLKILDPEDNVDLEFSSRSLGVGFRLLHVSTKAEADSRVRYNLDLARVWISASLRPAFLDWTPSTTPGRGDTVKKQETSNKSHGLSFNIAQKPGVGYTHTRGTTTGREVNENLSKIHADPCYPDDKQTSSIQWTYDIDDEHQRQTGRRFHDQQLPWVKFGLDDPTQRPRVTAGLLVTWSLPIATDQKEPRFPLSLFSSKHKQKPQPAFRNFLQKVTVSVPLEGLVGKCRTRNAVLSGTSDAPKLMAADGEQCRDAAAETALDTAGFEVLHVDAAFDAALFGCVQSADLERLGDKFSKAISIV